MPESQSQSVRIIFRADDAGLCPAVNAAFVEVLENGVISAAGTMAPAPAAREAAELLQKFNGQAGLGVHATITSEWDQVRWGPVKGRHKAPTLTDGNGFFFPNPNDVEQHFRVQDIVREVRGQYDFLCDAGLDLDYLDTHMGFNWLPGVDDALRELAEELGLFYRSSNLDQLGLERFPKDLARQMIEERDYSAFEDVPPGDYLWVSHPGGVPEDMPTLKADGGENQEIIQRRYRETQFFRDPATREALGAYGIERLTFRQLAAERS